MKERFDREVFALAHHYANTIGEGITLFWSGHEAEVAFRKELVERLGAFLPPDAIVTRPSALVACATDAHRLAHGTSAHGRGARQRGTGERIGQAGQ